MKWLAGRHRQRSKGRMESAAHEIVAGSEAFLAGGYVEHLRGRDELIPGWARLNIFAHGDLEDLELTYRSTTGSGSIGPAGETEEAWRTTLAALAGVLIEFVDGDPKMLSHLQRGVLIPLEFELMAADALTAFELLRCTRAALRSSIA